MIKTKNKTTANEKKRKAKSQQRVAQELGGAFSANTGHRKHSNSLAYANH